MIDLFITGGPLFMGLLSIVFISMLSLAVYIFLHRKSEQCPPVTLVRELGIFSLVVGFFGQFIGLYEAFAAIEQMESISPAMLAGGLKVSSITTLYGCLIFTLGWLIYFGLKAGKDAA